MQLWYDQPARFFEESLPIGNGKIGALLYGGADMDSFGQVSRLTATRMRGLQSGFLRSEKHSLRRIMPRPTRCNTLCKDITRSSTSRWV